MMNPEASAWVSKTQGGLPSPADWQVCSCSHLLEEGMEPFEVLPKGSINPSLLMALRVLFAPEEEFSQWGSLQG